MLNVHGVWLVFHKFGLNISIWEISPGLLNSLCIKGQFWSCLTKAKHWEMTVWWGFWVETDFIVQTGSVSESTSMLKQDDRRKRGELRSAEEMNFDSKDPNREGHLTHRQTINLKIFLWCIYIICDITPPPCSKTSIAPGDGHYSWVQDVHTSVMMWVRAVNVSD